MLSAKVTREPAIPGVAPPKSGDERASLVSQQAPVERVLDPGKRVKAALRMATASANADILTDIRSIVKNQLQILKNSALLGEFSSSQAQVLHRLAQVYSLLDAHTEREQAKYDFSQQSGETMAELEAQARRLLGQ